MQPVTETGKAKKMPAHLVGRKLIKCPYCRELLMDLDKHDKVELFTLPTKKAVRYREVKRCAACNKKIGYNLIRAAEKSQQATPLP